MFVTRSGVKRKTKTNCPWINLNSWSVLFMHSRRRRGLGKSLSGGRRRPAATSQRPAAPCHPLAPWDRDNHRQATFFFSGTGRHSPLHQSPLRHRQPGPPEDSVHDYKVQTGQQGPPVGLYDEQLGHRRTWAEFREFIHCPLIWASR